MTELLEIPFKPESGKPPTAVLHRLLDAIYRAGDKRLVLTLKEQKAKRSNAQNAYYFGVVVKTVTAFFREHGNYVDELDVHEFLQAPRRQARAGVRHARWRSAEGGRVDRQAHQVGVHGLHRQDPSMGC